MRSDSQPIGHCANRLPICIDRRRVIVGGLAIVLAVSLAIALLGPILPVWMLYALFGIWGATGLSIYALCIAHASDFAEPGQMVPLTSTLLLSWAIGSTIGPLLATLVMELIGPAGLFFYAAVISAATAGFVVYRMTRRASKPADLRGKFVNVPASSPQAMKLDPRMPMGKDDSEPGVK